MVTGRPRAVLLMVRGGNYQNAQQDPRLQAAVNYINSRRFREALNTLDQINERSAIWYLF